MVYQPPPRPLNNSGTPTGTVTFKHGTTTLGTGFLSAAKATFKTSKLAKGIHFIAAAYDGSCTYFAVRHRC
jgi:hypothetical protein